MTDYAVRRDGVGKISKKKSWKLFIAVFLLVIFLFAASNGIVKAREWTGDSQSRWDGVSSFVFALNDDEDYIAVFQKDPRRFVAFRLGSVFGEGASPSEIIKSLSIGSGVVIKNYLAGSGHGNLLEQFEEFKSYTTPVKIIFGAYDNADTNIARLDALRLWWQVKGLRVNDTNVVDIRDNYAGNTNSKVMGTNSFAVGREVRPYVENIKILSEDIEIRIVNSSGDVAAGNVLESFITNIGGRVITINGNTEVLNDCQVIGARTYTRDYLAKTFSCDINDQAFGEDNGQILTVVIGQEFRESYL